MPDFVDTAAYNAQTQRAQQAAQAQYQQAQASNLGETAAIARARLAWDQVMGTAAMTGQYNGQWTFPSQTYFANTFGTWGSPVEGQQTQAAQQQAYQQAYEQALAYGQYYAPGTRPDVGQQTQEAQQQQWSQQAANAAQFGTWFAPGQGPGGGQQTQAAQQQAYTQQLQAMQEARAAQTAQQQQAMSYLTLLSNLRGPADYAKYQQVLGSTPQGMRDLTAAAMGQYIPGGGATTGQQPQAISLQALQQQVGGTNAQQGAAMGGAGAAPGSQDNPFGQMPAPNQIAAQSWKNLAPSQQQMYLGAYESQGWNKDDVTALMNQSLPKYATNAPSAGTWRLAA